MNQGGFFFLLHGDRSIHTYAYTLFFLFVCVLFDCTFVLCFMREGGLHRGKPDLRSTLNLYYTVIPL